MVLIGLIALNTRLCFTSKVSDVGDILTPEEIIPCTACLHISWLFDSAHAWLQALIKQIGLLRQPGPSLDIPHVAIIVTHTPHRMTLASLLPPFIKKKKKNRELLLFFTEKITTADLVLFNQAWEGWQGLLGILHTVWSSLTPQGVILCLFQI